MFVLLLAAQTFKASDTLKVYYYANYPFAYNENGTVKGIDAEIVNEFVRFEKEKKGANDIKVVYTEYSDFEKFQSDLKKADGNTIGIGGITYTKERAKDFNFTSPYLKNVSVLVSQGSIPTIRINSPADIQISLEKKSALTIKNSTHEAYLNELKKSSSNLQIGYAVNLQDILGKIESDKNTFGYVDLIAYWSYIKKLKSNGSYLKIHRALNKSNESFSMILPKNEKLVSQMNEFFDSGLGFTSTKNYHEILEHYLGKEVIESVEIN